MDLRIPDDGGAGSPDADIGLLRRFADSFQDRKRPMVGFPVNLDFDYRPLADFLSLHLNNVGSPDERSEYGMDTKPFEQAVVAFFTGLAGGIPEEVFGHIAHGGTEANLFAAYVARERFPDAVLYASAEAHYSIPKVARVLRLPHVVVDADADGAVDLAALDRELRSRPGTAAIVIATIGSTGRGAMDDIPGIRETASAAGVRELFVHSDAASGGPLAEFGQPPVPWAFPAGADSVSVSGHKIVGSPIPSSVVLARSADVEAVNQPDAAVGSDDNTISGSRDALSPVFLWYALRRTGRAGLARRVRHCLEVTGYATRKLAEAGRHPSRAPGGNVVLFDLPPEDVLHRWRLLKHEDRGHLVVMPHVTREHIDRLCADLA
ncbi:histidine decarboxylase [Saccharothrix tamanrassetensis]|uniref:Histidine decarboxylase n=1 Tax=Saccharothrix tamanrassetensis TaxID=1051531 RepID=A0A841CDW2_9PSEU|nr:histidine decarboxylase [Saccharothrix tamanrassetensis]MBB5954215.1 histidine decarboxylase [Saccharothrix tamanrassetensis]